MKLFDVMGYNLEHSIVLGSLTDWERNMDVVGGKHATSATAKKISVNSIYIAI